MQLTPEELENIYQAAYKGFEVRQVAHLIGKSAIEFELLFEDEKHPAAISYMKGLYQAQSDLRDAVVSSAISVSSPAQAEMRKNLELAMISLKISLGQ